MIRALSLNLILALGWAALSGAFTGLNLLLGFIMGMLVLWLAGDALGAKDYTTGAWKTASYMIFFLRELFLSSFRVAWEVITPDNNIRPGVIGVELDDDLNDAQATLLANTITLTPGTLSLDIIEDEETKKRTLYIHAMYIDNPEDLKREIKEEFESRAKELLKDA